MLNIMNTYVKEYRANMNQMLDFGIRVKIGKLTSLESGVILPGLLKPSDIKSIHYTGCNVFIVLCKLHA